jgi:hypothetical protein
MIETARHKAQASDPDAARHVPPAGRLADLVSSTASRA